MKKVINVIFFILIFSLNVIDCRAAKGDIFMDINEIRIVEEEMTIQGWAFIEGYHHGRDITVAGPKYTLRIYEEKDTNIKRKEGVSLLVESIGNGVPYAEKIAMGETNIFKKEREINKYNATDLTCTLHSRPNKTYPTCLQVLRGTKAYGGFRNQEGVNKLLEDTKNNYFYRDIGFKFIVDIDDLLKGKCDNKDSKNIEKKFKMDLIIKNGKTIEEFEDITFYRSRIESSGAKIEFDVEDAPTVGKMMTNTGWVHDLLISPSKVEYYTDGKSGKRKKMTYKKGENYNIYNQWMMFEFYNDTYEFEDYYKPEDVLPYRVYWHELGVNLDDITGKALPGSIYKTRWAPASWLRPAMGANAKGSKLILACPCDPEQEWCAGTVRMSCDPNKEVKPPTEINPGESESVEVPYENPYRGFYSKVDTKWVDNKYCTIKCNEKATVGLPLKPSSYNKAGTGFPYDFNIINNISCQKSLKPKKRSDYEAEKEKAENDYNTAKANKPSSKEENRLEDLYEIFEDKFNIYNECAGRKISACKLDKPAPSQIWTKTSEVCGREKVVENKCGENTAKDPTSAIKDKFGFKDWESEACMWESVIDEGNCADVKEIDCKQGYHPVKVKKEKCQSEYLCAKTGCQKTLKDYIDKDEAIPCGYKSKYTYCSEDAKYGDVCAHIYTKPADCSTEKAEMDAAYDKWKNQYDTYQGLLDEYYIAKINYENAVQALKDYDNDKVTCDNWTVEKNYNVSQIENQTIETPSFVTEWEVEGNDFPYLKTYTGSDIGFRLYKDVKFTKIDNNGLEAEVETNFRIPNVYVHKYTGELSIYKKNNLYVSGDYKFFTDRLAKNRTNYNFTFKLNNLNLYDDYDYDWSLEYICVYGTINEFPTKEQGGEQTYMFRPISLINPFPGNRDAGYNWQGKEHLLTPYINHKPVYSEDNVIYTVNLTPMDMKRIRQYNSSRLYVDVPYTSEGKNNFIRHEFSNLFKKGNGFIR